MIVFPVYLRGKDSGAFSKFDNIHQLQYELEKIDVENSEFEAWDSRGCRLELRVQEPVWIKLISKENDTSNLLSKFEFFVKENGLQIKSPPQLDQIEAFLGEITRKQQASKVGLRLLSFFRKIRQ